MIRLPIQKSSAIRFKRARDLSVFIGVDNQSTLSSHSTGNETEYCSISTCVFLKHNMCFVVQNMKDIGVEHFLFPLKKLFSIHYSSKRVNPVRILFVDFPNSVSNSCRYDLIEEFRKYFKRILRCVLEVISASNIQFSCFLITGSNFSHTHTCLINIHSNHVLWVRRSV